MAQKNYLTEIIALPLNKPTVFLRYFGANPKAWITGMLDTSVCFSYIFSAPVDTWYAALLAIKIVLLSFFGASTSGAKAALPVTILITLAAVVTLWKSGESAAIAINYIGFAITLLCTSMLIRYEDILDYLRAISATGLAICTLYISMASAGLIPDHYGRMLFFGGAHPNLGGEAISIFLVALLACLRKPFFILIWLIMTTCIYLMQARAALLVAISVLLIYAWRTISISKRARPIYYILGAASLTLILFFQLDALVDFFANIFRASDESRGLGTGFVGREERWMQALEIFKNNPLLGGGFAAFESDDMLSPHNYFLAGLAYLGLPSLALFSYLFYGIYLLAKQNSDLALCLASLTPLFIFNDRFMNLNPYPFVFYIIILASIASRTRRRRPTTIKINETQSAGGAM